MKKIALLFVLIINHVVGFSQNLQTPDEFFGYAYGSKFSFHHRVIDYMRYAASVKPNQVKIIEYGKTYEGRPLLIAIVANTENLAKIEEIRKSNLQNIGLLVGKAQTKVPAIAWLSYNVHGNESASSNTVSKVLYELLNPENTTTQAVLKNTVVILDPCINPDGYDSYAQWFNRVGNTTPDASPYNREHQEPWPKGRYNHYQFDLNRDWAWQTQIESEKRIKLYNDWMPHLHSDFHEMGLNDPYYFPPAARPYHENLTAWQRDFHVQLGEFNKKYFDANNWLYYTKEQYDLFYPSYGDSYPSYNGAIGMTYEQGGIGAGLAVARDKYQDTLTLRQRIDHHFAASLATLETISTRADRTVEEFIKYHQNTQTNGSGIYKSYVLKNDNPAQIQKLKILLDKLQIVYGKPNKEQTAFGYNYLTQKDENFKLQNNDLLVSTQQPKGTFVKILFEPKSVLEDSLTYDVTAWALPYAYNLKAYALKTGFDYAQPDTSKNTQPDKQANIEHQSSNIKTAKPYAYLSPWKSTNDLKFLAQLLENGVKAKIAERNFEVGGKQYNAGTLVITRTNNENLGERFDKIVQTKAQENDIILEATTSGLVDKGYDFGSDYVFPIKAPKIVTLSGKGIAETAFGEVWHFFEQQIQYPITVVNTDDFEKIPLHTIDVLILPDGDYSKILTNKNTENIKKWIESGGKIIAMEGGAVAFADKEGFALKTKKIDEKEKIEEKPNFKPYLNRERIEIDDANPGSVHRVELDATHPLAFGYDGNYFALLRDTYNFDYLKEGWNVGHLKNNNLVAGFVGKNAQEKLKNTLIFGVEEMGKGKMIYMADNPLFRAFWEGGKLIFGNAVFICK